MPSPFGRGRGGPVALVTLAHDQPQDIAFEASLYDNRGASSWAPLALLEVTIVLARLVQRGRLVALRPDEAKPQGASSLSVKGGLPARFEARRDGAACSRGRSSGW